MSITGLKLILVNGCIRLVNRFTAVIWGDNSFLAD